MDRESMQAMRRHYDKHANANLDSRQAKQAREKGVAAPLKKFHNTIKRQLINRFAYGVDRLLDFACGRGGDILKWMDAEVKYVKGVDLSPNEITEARKRYEESYNRRHDCVTHAEFEDSDQLGLSPWVEQEKFDVVTCMFAIHYFFVSESALKMFLKNVSDNLKDGGFFFGTCPDGKRVLALLNQTSQWISNVATLHARWQGKYGCFGSAFNMAISDTVTEGHEFNGVQSRGSYEYLVFRNVLEGVAAQYNLFPVIDYQDPGMDDLFVEEDHDKLFKHFNSRYPHSDPDLEKASGVNVAFCFQKLEGGKEVGITVPPVRAPTNRGGGGGAQKRDRDLGEGSSGSSRPRHY